MGRNKISISVAGSELVVTTDEDREYTTSLAQAIDRKINTLLQENTRLTVGLAAILVCLDLCDENEKNKASCSRLREELRRYLAQAESAGAELQKQQEQYSSRLEALERENELLRDRLAQYEQGQIGFQP